MIDFRKVLFFSFLMPALFIFGCEEEQEEISIPKTSVSYQETEPEYRSPTSQYTLPETMVDPRNLVVADQRVYVSDRPGQPGRPTLYVLDADSGDLVGYMGQRRHGPGDLVSITIMGLRPGAQPRLALFDPTQLVVSFLDSEAADDDLRSGARIAELELNDIPDGLAFLSDGRIWASGIWSEPFRVIELSEQGGRRQRLIPTPGYQFGRSPRVFNELWHSVMAAGGDPEVVAIAARYAARIDLYESDGEPQRAIEGPDTAEPAYRHPDDDRRGFEFTEDAIYGYLEVEVHGSSIVALYSGRNYRRDDGEYGNYIHVFDLEGNVSATFELDVPVRSISMDGQTGRLYGLADDKQVVAFDLLD